MGEPRIRSWVCIKGLKQDARHWRGLPAELASRTGGVALPMSLPGAGELADAPVPDTVEGMAAMLRARFAAEADPSQGPWGVLGLSLGGMVALAWAHAFPGDLGGVVVGNTSAADLSPPWRRIRAARWPQLLRASLPMDAVRREEHAVRLTTSRQIDPQRVRRIAEEQARWQRERPFTRRALAGQLRAASRFRTPPSLSVPALVLIGAGDGFVDPACGHALADRLGAARRVHPTAGHELGLDAPAWLVATAARWALGDDQADGGSHTTAPSGIR